MRRRASIGTLVLIVALVSSTWAWTGLSGHARAGAAAQVDLAQLLPPADGTPSAEDLGAIDLDDVDLSQLPAGAGSPGVYIQFDEPTHNLDYAHGYPVIGGHARFSWKALEPGFDGDYKFDSAILPWVEQEVARGKKVCIGFVTYNGRQYGGMTVPDWLITRDPNVRLYNTYTNDGWYVLNYLNATYVAEYSEMITHFAQWVAANPVVRNNLAWVEIGTGLFGENQPTANNTHDSKDRIYYRDYAPRPGGGSGWTSANWIDHVNAVSLFYRNAFNSVGMNSLPIFTNIAPTFLAAWERDVTCDYAASIGVGLKHAGLLADHDNAAASYGPLIKYATGATKVPICWEGYGPDTWGTPLVDWYWMVLGGLAKHPDYFLPTRGVVTYADYKPITAIADEYSGVTLGDTPGVWVALRETFRVGQWDNPEHGNFNFWLYQDDGISGGRTVTETYRSDAITQNVKNRLGLPVYNPALGTFKEGWTTRRTNEGDGNPYMWFKIDNGYINGGTNQVNIDVTYFDIGADKWSLQYDSTSGMKDAVPNGSGNAYVQKANTRTWKTATFTITDGRFANTLTGGADFRVNCMNDGNDWFHLIKVSKAGGSAPTPTPTSSPSPTATPTRTPTGGAATQIQLRTGPNLVAYNGPSRPIAEALASIDGKYTKVYAAVYEYNTAQGKYALVWKQYIVGAPPFVNTLTQLDPWVGYWVYVTQDCVWSVSP